MEKKIKILNLSSKHPATVADRMQCKLMSGVEKLENAIGKEISVQNIFFLEMENTEKAEIYSQLVLKCENDKWYYTCSSSFTEDMEECFEEAVEIPEDKFVSIVVVPVTVPSKNNSGSFYKARFVKVKTSEDVE